MLKNSASGRREMKKVGYEPQDQQDENFLPIGEEFQFLNDFYDRQWKAYLQTPLKVMVQLVDSSTNKPFAATYVVASE